MIKRNQLKEEEARIADEHDANSSSPIPVRLNRLLRRAYANKDTSVSLQARVEEGVKQLIEEGVITKSSVDVRIAVHGTDCIVKYTTPSNPRWGVWIGQV